MKNFREIENDKSILNYVSKNGTPLWFFMRNSILIVLLPKKLGIIDAVENPRKTGMEVIAYFLISALYNLKKTYLLKKDHKIVFYTPCRGVVEKGKFRNIYCDDFAVSIADSLVFENAPVSWKWPGKRFNDNTYVYAINYAFNRIKSIFGYRKEIEQVTQLAVYVSKRIKEICGVDLTQEEIQGLIKQTCKEAVAMENHSKWLIKHCKRMRTKYIVIPGASHSNYCYLNKLAKQEKIKIIEIQHGLITKDADIINYASKLLVDPRLKAACPDIFLSFGEWWNTQTNIPFSNKTAIGSMQRDRNKGIRSAIQKTILIVGGGNRTEDYFVLAEHLLSKFSKQYSIVFRPHPIEKNIAQSISRNHPNVSLDVNDSVYRTLGDSAVVLGEVSTVLFEAIGIVDKIIIWKTQYSNSIFQEYPFPSFTDFSELDRIIEDDNGKTVINDHDYWEQNAVEKFKNYVMNLDNGGIIDS